MMYVYLYSNPGYKTIEGELLEALAKVDAFPKDMKSDVGKVRTAYIRVYMYNGMEG